MQFLIVIIINYSSLQAQTFDQNLHKCDSLSFIEDYLNAQPYCSLAYEQAQLVENLQDSIKVNILILSALSNFQTNNIEIAEKQFVELAEITFQRTGISDTFLWAQVQLVDIYALLQDNEKKLKSIHTVINGFEKTSGDNDINLWYYYYLAGESYILNGDYAASIRSFTRAEELYLMGGRTKDENYARILVENSSNFLIVGKYENCIENNSKALQILETLEEKYLDIEADAYQLMSWAYVNIDSVDVGLNYVLKLIELASLLEPLPKANNLVSSTLYLINIDIQYGTYYAKEAGLDKALYRALEIYDTLDPGAIYINNVYIALGNYYAREGIYDSVIHYYKTSLNLIGDAYGKNNIIYLNAFYSLARNYEFSGDIETAELAYDSLLLLDENFLRSNFIFLSESEQESIFSSFMMHRNGLFSFYHKNPVTRNKKSEVFYDSELFIKGLLLQNITSLRNSILATKDSSMMQEFNYWIGLKQTLVSMYLNNDPAAFELEKQTEQLEKKISKKNNSMQPSGEIFGWKQIHNTLKSDEASVEFIHFSDETEDIYYALILRADEKLPIAVPLLNATEFQEILYRPANESISSYITRIYTYPDPEFPEDTAYYSGERLYSMLWEPLEKYLKDIKTVYISPSGLFHQLAFNALPYSVNETLIDKYSIIVLSSTGDIVQKKQPFKYDQFLLAGGIQYGYDATSTQAIPWKLLPGTVMEIKSIEEQLSQENKKVTIISNDEATEKYFKQIPGDAYDVLHLATHGYFYDAALLTDVSSSRNKFSATKNPLLRSGLILTNANKFWFDTNAAGDDGTLTAYEISNLNLYGVSLVILSACETGLGDIKGSEGVYGLQRAFKMAGVDQLVISLWQVPDKYTAELMSRFYENLMQGESPEVALKNAQLYLKKKTGVYNWAAFVLIQ